MSRQSDDLALWQQWHRTRRKKDLQPLLHQLQPVISGQVNRWSGSLAAPLLETRAKVLATDAIKDYNPHRGAALATHVTNKLQKLSRMVYTHTQAARLPEHKTLSIASFKVAQEALGDQFGREPTLDELADDLGWSVNRTKAFNEVVQRKELLGSGEFNPASFSIADDEDPIVGFVYHDMAPTTKRLFEDITGFGGAKPLANSALMKKHKLTQGQLSYQKRQLTKIFDV